MGGNRNYDAVVVGGGTAGATAAYHLAKEGLRVALLERRRLPEAGARWVNGVAPWMFDRAGIPRPEAPELRAKDAAFLLHGKDGTLGVRVDRSPVWQVDMRLLVARLHAMAREAGVDILDQARPGRLAIENGRATMLEAALHRKGTVAFEAQLFVDATGYNGVLRRQAPGLAAGGAMHNSHLCSAAQEVRRIRDRESALRFLERYGGRDGDCIGFVGVAGGYSTLVVQVDIAHGEVELLTGAIADGRYASGPELIQRFCTEEAWVGEKVFGGAGVIPLRRPWERIASGGVALVGDAACQVFPAHGSGIATGMIAARILAEGVGKCDDPGGARALWRYQSSFMREVGSVLAAYDVVRRLSQTLSEDEAGELLTSGLTSPRMTSAALEQRLPKVTARDLHGVARGIVRAPGAARKLAPNMLRMQAAYWLYRLHPAAPDPRLHSLWAKAVAKVFGEQPEESETAATGPIEHKTAA